MGNGGVRAKKEIRCFLLSVKGMGTTGWEAAGPESPWSFFPLWISPCAPPDACETRKACSFLCYRNVVFFFQAVRVCAHFSCSSSLSKVATRHSSMPLAGSHQSSQFLLYTVLLFFSLSLSPVQLNISKATWPWPTGPLALAPQGRSLSTWSLRFPSRRWRRW